MLLREIINQNYFQFDKNYYKGNTGISMGSTITGIAAKIFLQYLKNLPLKYWMETGEVIYYNKYVIDILIIFHHKKLARTKFMHT